MKSINDFVPFWVFISKARKEKLKSFKYFWEEGQKGGIGGGIVVSLLNFLFMVWERGLLYGFIVYLKFYQKGKT